MKTTGAFLLGFGLLVAAVSGESWAFNVTKSAAITTTGQSFTFQFDSLPPVSTGAVTVTVDLFGDYDSSEEYATVTIDGTSYGQHDGGKSCPPSALSKSFSVPASDLADNSLVVEVANSSSVDASCPVSKIDVSVTYSSLPDLLVSSATVPASGTADKAGDTFTVDYAIRCWHEPVNQSFEVHFSYCSSMASATCTKIDHDTITDVFAASQQRSYTSKTLTIPATALFGSSYIRVMVDGGEAITETVESNNSVFGVISITEKPDLSVGSVKVPLAGSTTGPGDTFTAQLNIANAAATSAVVDTFSVSYAFCSGTSASTCVALADADVLTDIPSGGSIPVASPLLTVPPWATNGTYYLLVVLDVTGVVDERDETNNEHFAELLIGIDPPDGGADAGDAGPDGPPPDLPPLHDLPRRESGWMWPDSAPADDTRPPAADGCSCRTAGSPLAAGTPLPALIAALAMLLVLLRRR